MAELPVLVNVSLIGNKHINRATPCEDASCTLSRNGVSVVCVADGAGDRSIRMPALVPAVRSIVSPGFFATILMPSISRIERASRDLFS